MTDIFLQIENQEDDHDALLSYIDKYVPDMHCDNLHDDCGSSSTNFIIVKIHSNYDNIQIKREKLILLRLKILSFFKFMFMRRNIIDMAVRIFKLIKCILIKNLSISGTF